MTLTATRRRMFVNGDWSDAADGETTPVINPATEETIDEVPKGTEADIDRAVEAARDSVREWSQTTPGERSAMLWKWAAEDRGEPRRSCPSSSRPTSASPRASPISTSSSASTTCASSPARRECVEGKAAGEYPKGFTSMVRREPVGVVGQVAPWNYPLMMAIWKLGPHSRPAIRSCSSRRPPLPSPRWRWPS